MKAGLLPSAPKLQAGFLWEGWGQGLHGTSHGGLQVSGEEGVEVFRGQTPVGLHMHSSHIPEPQSLPLNCLAWLLHT